MGYNIEVTFSIVKNSSVTELQNDIKNFATNCGCNYFYEDFEFESNTKHKRNHSITTINFNDTTKICEIIRFLKNIKNIKGLYIELIYDENNNKIIYASKYYITQKMCKKSSKSFIEEKNNTTYSEDDVKIIEIMSKK